MIVDNLIYYAAFIFSMLIVGLVLTVIEFRYGEPKRQQQAAAKKGSSGEPTGTSETVRPAR